MEIDKFKDNYVGVWLRGEQLKVEGFLKELYESSIGIVDTKNTVFYIDRRDILLFQVGLNPTPLSSINEVTSISIPQSVPPQDTPQIIPQQNMPQNNASRSRAMSKISEARKKIAEDNNDTKIGRNALHAAAVDKYESQVDFFKKLKNDF